MIYVDKKLPDDVKLSDLCVNAIELLRCIN